MRHTQGWQWDNGIYQLQSRPIYASGMKKHLTPITIYFFWTKICLDSVPKEMGSYGMITSQLKKFLFLVGNQTGWDEIYQSYSCPVYASRIKKYLTPIPKFFYRTKIYPNPVPNGMGSCGKNYHPQSYLYHYIFTFKSLFILMITFNISIFVNKLQINIIIE